MVDEENENEITIDGKSYKLDKISDKAREFLLNIQFVDKQIKQLSNEWAIADTARIGYTNALKVDLSKMDSGK